MLNLKKIGMFLFLVTVSVSPMLVEGQYQKPTGDYQTYDPGDSGDVNNILDFISQWILRSIAALSVLFIIIGGVMYIISAGGDTEKAKNMIFNAIIGLTVALLGYAIVYVIGNVLSNE